jgi:hypothetical protein
VASGATAAILAAGAAITLLLIKPRSFAAAMS